MAKRNVVWTRTADIQFVGVLEYWVKRNKSNSYSKKLVKLLLKEPNKFPKSHLFSNQQILKEQELLQW